jgi:hypothetical protein
VLTLVSLSGNASLGNNDIGEFLFYLTHMATPQDTWTTPQGTYTRRSFGFYSLTRSNSELQQTLLSFSGT